MDGDEYDLHLHDTSALAFFVSETGKRKDAFWLPRSRVSTSATEHDIGSVIKVEIPDWLAEREGLA